MGYKKGRLSKEDVQYISENVGKASIEEIAKALNRDPLTIAKNEAILKYKPEPVTPAVEPQPVKADPLDNFSRHTKGGKKGGIVQMTEASAVDIKPPSQDSLQREDVVVKIRQDK